MYAVLGIQPLENRLKQRPPRVYAVGRREKKRERERERRSRSWEATARRSFTVRTVPSRFRRDNGTLSKESGRGTRDGRGAGGWWREGNGGERGKSRRVQRSIHVGRTWRPVRGATANTENKDSPWSVQMGYQFTTGSTPGETRLTRGSPRITPTITGGKGGATAPTRTQKLPFPQFVQDGECATLPRALPPPRINTITSRSPRGTRSHRRATRRRIPAGREHDG